MLSQNTKKGQFTSTMATQRTHCGYHSNVYSCLAQKQLQKSTFSRFSSTNGDCGRGRFVYILYTKRDLHIYNRHGTKYQLCQLLWITSCSAGRESESLTEPLPNTLTLLFFYKNCTCSFSWSILPLYPGVLLIFYCTLFKKLRDSIRVSPYSFN